MAEELALEQRIGDRAAVHRHEGLSSPWAGGVDRLGDQLLARAALARDQHVARGGGAPHDLLAHDTQGNARAHEQRRARGCGTRGRPRVPETARAPQEAPHAQREIGQPERLLQVVAGALAQRLDRRLDGRVARHEDDRRARVQRAGLLEHLQPADTRHDDVCDDDVKLLLLDPSQRLLAAAGRGHTVSFGLEEDSQSVLRGGLVVHDENRRSHHLTSLALPLGSGRQRPAVPRRRDEVSSIQAGASNRLRAGRLRCRAQPRVTRSTPPHKAETIEHAVPAASSLLSFENPFPRPCRSAARESGGTPAADRTRDAVRSS